MGVGAMVGATLLGGLLQAREQRQQANAQAKQAEANAQIAYNNAEKLQKQAEEQAQNDAMNQENKRRSLRRQLGTQAAAVGASGLSMSGSALDLMSESQYEIEKELAIDSYNDRQKVDQMFQSSTDNVNQGDVYMQNARNYRKAGKRAAMNTMIMTGLSMAASLYTPGSTGAAKQTAGKTWVGTAPLSKVKNPYNSTLGVMR